MLSFASASPPETPVLLRQDSYKALTESVQSTNPDGTVVNTTHTARFGEMEQRFYATTPKGRAAAKAGDSKGNDLIAPAHKGYVAIEGLR